NLFLVMFRNSTITDLFLFVFTQLILHYQTNFWKIRVYSFFALLKRHRYIYSFLDITLI
ncbi:capsular biosynthesis protein CpsC, partial [Lactococcus cremoris]|nr:capsular biosynthesis protein CpsC [Lactococcus cremoris]